jgi:hypothetical protein
MIAGGLVLFGRNDEAAKVRALKRFLEMGNDTAH